MYRQDIVGSQAYAQALARAGILTQSECDSLQAGLGKVLKEWEAGTFVLHDSDEDIHTANERRLSDPDICGDLGGKLHTGRSRNDQVATDVRLWLKDEIKLLQTHMNSLLKIAADRAEAEVDIIMPGYTHLQPAQPVRWSHWIMSHATAFQRDAAKLGA